MTATLLQGRTLIEHPINQQASRDAVDASPRKECEVVVDKKYLSSETIHCSQVK